MEKQTQKRPGGSRGSAPAAPIGDPQVSSSGGGSSQERRAAGASSASTPVSAKYIDSRLKQFCLR